MPILIVLLLAALGVGWFERGLFTGHCNCQHSSKMTKEELPPPPEHNAWADSCKARLDAAARDYASLMGADCNAGETTIERLPSGVPYVEYAMRKTNGALFQVTVTEEPQNAGEDTDWRGAPACRHGYADGLDVVRHDHGRLARVYVEGAPALDFGRIFQSAVDECVQSAN